MTTPIRVNSITCAYDKHTVIEKLSVAMNTGDSVCLLGPSGCGKTTLLRMLAGFETPTAGTI